MSILVPFFKEASRKPLSAGGTGAGGKRGGVFRTIQTIDKIRLHAILGVYKHTRPIKFRTCR